MLQLKNSDDVNGINHELQKTCMMYMKNNQEEMGEAKSKLLHIVFSTFLKRVAATTGQVFEINPAATYASEDSQVTPEMEAAQKRVAELKERVFKVQKRVVEAREKVPAYIANQLSTLPVETSVEVPAPVSETQESIVDTTHLTQLTNLLRSMNSIIPELRDAIPAERQAVEDALQYAKETKAKGPKTEMLKTILEHPKTPQSVKKKRKFFDSSHAEFLKTLHKD